MTIDVRARVESSLGPVISASISDDYIQGNGLIKTSGNCLIKGLVNPPIGTLVTFRYTKNGVTRQIPRVLRVLSSFADPFRKTTSVQLGCKLTYLQDLTDPIDWTAFDDEETEFVESDSEIVLVPITAASIMRKCLLELGITASSVPLTNLFSVDSFDLGGGYVQVLSDLLVSESYCGYLDKNETLRIISLNESGGSGTILQSADVIDIGEIGVGQLPGDAVIVNYSTLKLKLPSDTQVANEEGESQIGEDLFHGWLTSETINKFQTAISYKSRLNESNPMRFDIYNILNTSVETVSYKIVRVDKKDGPGSEDVSLVDQKLTLEATSSPAILGAYGADILSIGYDIGLAQLSTTTKETFEYDEFGNEIRRVLLKYGDSAHVIGALGIAYAYLTPFLTDDGEVVYIWTPVNFDYFEQVWLEGVVVETKIIGNTTRRLTRKYAPWWSTIQGQQALAAARDYIDTLAEAQEFIEKVKNLGLGLNPWEDCFYLIESTVEIAEGIPQPPRKPSNREILAQTLSDGGDPSNGYSTESTASIELALGSPTAQRRVEFSMPYAPDDSFYKTGTGYYSFSSDAPAKAKLFGITQNRLLLGNRSGMNIQTVPEKLPEAPFSAFFVSLNGTVAMYRTNGTSWTIDESGIIASTDALYWGVAGRMS